MNKTKFFNDSGGNTSDNMTNGMKKNDMSSGNLDRGVDEQDRQAGGK